MDDAAIQETIGTNPATNGGTGRSVAVVDESHPFQRMVTPEAADRLVTEGLAIRCDGKTLTCAPGNDLADIELSEMAAAGEVPADTDRRALLSLITDWMESGLQDGRPTATDVPTPATT